MLTSLESHYDDAISSDQSMGVRVETQTFQVHQLCCQNAMRDERNATRRYGLRHEQFKNYVRNHGFGSILSLKELRNCKDAEGVLKHPLHFVGDLLSQEMNVPDETECTTPFGKFMQLALIGITKQHLTDRLPEYAPFHLAQLYDPNTFVFHHGRVFDYHEEVFGSKTSRPHMGGAVIVCDYEVRRRPGFRFLVESFHAPFEEADKDAVAAWVRDVYPVLRNAHFGVNYTLNIIRVGDFNFFADKPKCKHQEQAYLRGFVEGTREMFHAETGERVYGTFFPSPDDAYSKNAADPYDGDDPLVGRLDRLYYTGAFAVRKVQIMAPPRDKLRSFDDIPISDHFPLAVTLEVLA